jgi:hypothetical protein
MKTRSHFQLLREAGKGLAQQMILWGHDVKHPQGNALQRCGMERVASTGLQGTSCYRMEWEGGWVQLHGAVASWHAADGSGRCGCVYARSSKRIKTWSEHRAPVPGVDQGQYRSPEECWEAFQPLLRWLVAYETWVASTLGAEWRWKTWRAQFSLVKKSPWLAPAEALPWWEKHAEADAIRVQ